MGEFPSRKHQWKPGQSGNPKGRPKGTGLTDKLRAILDKDDGEIAQRLVEAGVQAALGGDFRFWNAIFERIEGHALENTVRELVISREGDAPDEASLARTRDLVADALSNGAGHHHRNGSAGRKNGGRP